MITSSYIEVFRLLGAEVVLAVGALAALTFDLGWARRTELPSRNRSVALVALAAVVMSALPLWNQAMVPSSGLLDGALVSNHLTVLFKAVVLVLTGLAVVLSMEHDIGDHIGEYYAVLLFGAIGMTVLVSSEELITIFVALELLSLCLYILTASQKRLLRSQEAALKYFMFGAISSAFLLFGMSYLVGISGTTYLREFPETLTGPSSLLNLAMLMMLVGFGFKIAVVPFHLWAPDAYQGAPTPVAAFIATASKVASFVVLLKVVLVGLPMATGAARWGGFEAGWISVLAVAATLSMILGNVAAIVQRNLKRLLAYSSIAHAGYILIGIIAATQMGASAVLFYVIVYALTNLGAFGVVAVLARSTAGDDINHFNGMARRAPFLSLLMLIFVLSLAGVPPLSGFFGKFYLFAAAIDPAAGGDQFGLLWLVALGIFMSAVSLYYYLIVLKHFYVIDAKDAAAIRTPTYQNVVLGLVALAVIGLGVLPEPLLAFLNRLVESL